MGMRTTVYVFYGVLIGVHNATVDEQNSYEIRDLLDEMFGEDTETVADNVRHFMCGNYDSNNLYLRIDQDGKGREVTPGEYRTIGLGDDGDTASWSVQLYNAAEEIGVEVLEGPCWFVVPDVG